MSSFMYANYDEDTKQSVDPDKPNMATLSTNVDGNTVLVDVDGNAIALHLASKIRAAIAEAYGRNYVEQAPWFNPPLWVTGTTYVARQFVRTSTGRIYYMNPAVSSAVAGATEPSHVSGAIVYDGGGTSGCPWHYFGMVNAVKSGEVKSTVVPVAATDAMNGLYCTLANTSTLSTLGLSKSVSVTHGSAGFDLLGGEPYWFSATNCTIASNVLTVAGTVTGTIKAPMHQAWVGSISSYVRILAQLTGTPGGAGTYSVAAIADKLTPFTLTNNSYPRADVTASNGGTVADPAPISSYFSVRFTTNARWVAIERQVAFAAATTFSVLIDGRLVSLNDIDSPSVSGDKVLLLNLAAVSEKADVDVELVIKTPLIENLVSIYVGPDDYVIPHKNNGLTLTLEGDSIAQGGNGMPYSPHHDQALMLARMLGFDNYYDSAIGSTRLATDVAGKTRFIERLDDVILHAPDVHVLSGIHNDVVNSTEAQVKTELRTYIDTFRAALPDSYLVITGIRLLRDETKATNFGTYEGYVQTVVAEYASTGRVFFCPIHADDVSWYPTSAVSGRYYQASGDAHPLLPEALMVTNRIADRVRDVFASIS